MWGGQGPYKGCRASDDDEKDKRGTTGGASIGPVSTQPVPKVGLYAEFNRVLCNEFGLHT
jgi:hypothetical protein